LYLLNPPEFIAKFSIFVFWHMICLYKLLPDQAFCPDNELLETQRR